ncbi:MAG: queuosine precursor transporter [Propionibacteriaceae bacterium]|nr:queuosine precursor transporter [Propionibacteriaceae bacterium]
MSDDPTAAPPAGPPGEPPARSADVVAAAFCGLLLTANVAATKLIEVGPAWAPGGVPVLPLVFDGGAVVFPLTYILGDILAEVYGFRRARRAILLGFALSAAAALTFALVDLAPAAAGWGHGAAWHAVLGFVPRIAAASLAGYLAGQLLNARLLTWLRDRARPGSLWSRLLGSTALGGAADTVLFCVIAFGGVVSAGTLANYIAVGYVYKLAVEALLLPVTVRVIQAVKRGEARPLGQTGRRDRRTWRGHRTAPAGDGAGESRERRQ